MSYIFPKTLFRTGTVLDWLEFDEQVGIFAQEINGHLNEHNLDEMIGHGLRTAGKLAENVAIRVFSNSNAVDHLIEANLFQIPPGENWTAVTTCDVNPGGPGGKLFVTYSFQVMFDDTTIVSPQGPGLQFCIELDGAPQLSTLLGSGDFSNDRHNGDTVASSQIPVNAGGSIRAFASAHCVEGLFTVDSGRHTVRLLARNPYSHNSATRQHHYVGNVECIAMHLWA